MAKNARRKIRVNVPVDSQGSGRGSWKLNEVVRNLVISVDGDNEIEAVPVIPVNLSGSVGTLQTGTIVNLYDPASPYYSPTVLGQNIGGVVTYRFYVTGNAALEDAYVNGVYGERNPWNSGTWRQVSAANTANVLTIEDCGAKAVIAIRSVCSAGTASLTVEVSADDATTWVALDVITAAATIVKYYVIGTLGATVALPPLAFSKIRITVGAAGAGNTTTLEVGIK